ncbi:MAG: selenium cofactor biosynthesis protein YqeC [Pseudomonadota bacterium]
MHSLIDILGLDRQGVISIIGAGGKTSLMFHLAREISLKARTVLTTCTTKIMMPEKEQSPHTVIAGSLGELLEKSRSGLTRFHHLTAAERQDPDTGKLTGFQPLTIDRLHQASCFDWIIVEADGAKRKPLKATDTHEPVVPATTTHLVLVTGLDAVGLTLDDHHVHRAGIFSQTTGLPLGAPVDERSIAASAVRELKKAAALPFPPLTFILLNKADTPERVNSGRTIAGLCKYKKIVNRVIVASLKDTNPVRVWFDCNAVDDEG